jgi:hypothetical protein
MTAATALLIALDRSGMARWWRMAAFPLWAMSALGFLQAWARTCVVLAMQGTCDAETGRTLSADEVEALRGRGKAIMRRVVMVALAVTVATLALP